MDHIVMENMFRIIEEHNIEINREINGDCFCTICHKMMVDACNGPCGCRYCRKCITEYLRDDKKECPGLFEYCRTQLIDMDTDIFPDRAINRKISKLIIQCPNMDCKSELELGSIENHLRICEKRYHSCPFTNIGCTEDKLYFDKVDEHLASDTRSHCQLLIDWMSTSINDMKLENINLRNKINSSEERNKILVTKNDEQDKIIKEMKKRQEDHEIIQQNLLVKIKELDRIVNQMKQNEKKNSENSIIKHDEQDKIISEIKNKQENQEKFQKNLLAEQKKQDKMISEMKEIQKRKAQTHESRLNKLSVETRSIKESIVETRFGEFVWIIDKWSRKLKLAQNGINEILTSDEFLSHRNGYKMELQLYPNGGGNDKGKYLSLYFFIKKGPFDNILQWPFNYNVEFALMKQSTGLPHYTYIVQYNENQKGSYSKPIKESNIGYGVPQYIKISEISSNAALTKNNQIIIKFSVKQ